MREWLELDRIEVNERGNLARMLRKSLGKGLQRSKPLGGTKIPMTMNP
jgi:hypothetical protein